jgi:Zn-dependent protease with chaperone function
MIRTKNEFRTCAKCQHPGACRECSHGEKRYKKTALARKEIRRRIREQRILIGATLVVNFLFFLLWSSKWYWALVVETINLTIVFLVVSVIIKFGERQVKNLACFRQASKTFMALCNRANAKLEKILIQDTPGAAVLIGWNPQVVIGSRTIRYQKVGTGALAHEIGHTASTWRAVFPRSTVITFLLIPIVLMVFVLLVHPKVLIDKDWLLFWSMVLALLVPVIGYASARLQEYEADARAIALLGEKRSLIALLEQSPKEQNWLMRLFDSHPSSKSRIAAIHRMMPS